MSRTLILSTALALVLAAPAVAQTGNVRDLSVEQSTGAPASTFRPAGLIAQAWFDRPDATYALGETVRLFVSTNEDAYVTALSIGPTGNVTQLFPNAFNGNNAVRANTPLEIPGPGARNVVTGPVGEEVVKIIVTRRPVQVIPESQFAASSPFRSVIGGAGALVRDLQTVANPAFPDQEIAILDKTFSSAPWAPAAYGSGVIVIVPAAPASRWAPYFYPLPAIAPSPWALQDFRS